jgi:hypothetical protein
MEWKKVLNSPHSAQLRRELPVETAAALGAINIIEGIERLLFALDDSGTLIILEGDFDRVALKGSAASEGAEIKTYKSAEIIVPEEAEEDDVLMALISAKHILLGFEATLMRAIDRAEKSRATNRAPGFDLWIGTPTTETGWQIGDTLRVFRNGIWTPVESTERPQGAKPPDPAGKIRIYGLDEGVREVPLENPKPTPSK